MAAAHAIIRAIRAIRQAGQVLAQHGRPLPPVYATATETAFARDLALREVTTCLAQPAQRLVNLIHNRAVGLAADAAELEAIAEEFVPTNPKWGAF